MNRHSTHLLSERMRGPSRVFAAILFVIAACVVIAIVVGAGVGR